MLIAFIDESMRIRSGEDVRVYAMSAVIVDDTDLDDVRNALKGLRYGKTPRIHWRDERPERWSPIAKSVSELPVSGVVTVCMHVAATRQERARRLCLTQMLAELGAEGVELVICESRGQQDNEDLRLLLALRRRSAEGAGVRVEFEAAVSEPALWAADVVAGAFTWWLNGDGAHWELLQEYVRIVDVHES